jgi:hypothetical protein
VLALAAPAYASRSMEIGLQDDAVFVDQAGMGRTAAFERAHEIGVTTIRANMLWARVMAGKQADQRKRPATPRYDFTRFDALVNEARARGFRVQLTLTAPAPAWATKGRTVSTRSVSVKEFGRWTAVVAKHFKARVSRYSLWNEPNWYSWLSPHKTGAAQYRKLYLTGYRAVKKADRKAKVIFGELAPRERPGASASPLPFINDVLCIKGQRIPSAPPRSSGLGGRWVKRKRCATVRADGVSVHPYDYAHAPNAKKVPAGDVSVGTVGRLTSALTHLKKAHALATPGGKQPRVHLTEFAYFAGGPLALPITKRARYITQAFAQARANPKVAQILYFGLVQNPFIQWNTGLLKPDGTPDTTFDVLRRWIDQQHRSGRLTSG